MNIRWNAVKYTKDFSFVHEYGNDVLQLLDLNPNMTVLDLGCGNGALTQKLCDLGVTAIGLDSSEDLLNIASHTYPELSFLKADATNFVLNAKVDAVFSNAVLHWIDLNKQPDVLKCIADSLNKHGQFVFEFGGLGNNQLIHSVLEETFHENGFPYENTFFFPSIGTFAPLLESAGFKVTFMTLFDRMTPLTGPNGMEDWINMLIKSPFESLTNTQKRIILDQSILKLKPVLFHDNIWYADYVRIRGKAIKN